MIAILAVGAILALAGGTRADEPYEAAAKRLSAATVMVRMSWPAEEDVRSGSQGETSTKSNTSRKSIASGKSGQASGVERATIGSGVAVGENLIVTAMRPDRDCRFALTLPGGARAEGKPCVIDANSSLTLLEVATAAETTEAKVALAPVSPSEKQPVLGSRLLAASAWGAELPSVSLGVLGGVDRFIPGAGLPPLVQCDVHTTDASLGAGIVNVDGELVGIIVACDGRGGNSRWTYAVPAEHVRRLLDARREGQLVEIPRRRPHAGIELRQLGGSEEIVVRSVVPEGPAAKAGLEAGDVLEAFDGQQAHSVIEAARQVARRKPGDAVEFRVRRGDRTIKCVVTLVEGEGEPTFSFANNRGERTESRSVRARRGGLVGEREETAESRTSGKSERAKAGASDRKIAMDDKGGTADFFKEFREQLRERDERIARLEAELAELRRERPRRPVEDAAPAKVVQKDGAQSPVPASRPDGSAGKASDPR
ncbi:MAG: S1C family serine protease [Pirellulales bacterium]